MPPNIEIIYKHYDGTIVTDVYIIITPVNSTKSPVGTLVTRAITNTRSLSKI